MQILAPSVENMAESPDASTTDPLHGFLPRKVSGAQARKALVSCGSDSSSTTNVLKRLVGT